MLRILGLTIIVFASAVLGCKYNPTPRESLDFSQYQGKWYLLETGPVDDNGSCPLDCVNEEYMVSDNPIVFNLDWHGQTFVGEVIKDGGVVTVIDPFSQPALLNFYLDKTVFLSKVLATDYSTWAIEYTCHDELGYERFMLRSRTPTISQELRKALHNVINGYGVNVEDFAVVKHSDCV